MLTFFADAAGTTPLLVLPVNTFLALAPTRLAFWVGYAGTAGTIRPAVDDQITLQVVDAAAGSGYPASAVRLALSEVGLDTAVAGASLDIAESIAAGERVEVWIEVASAAPAAPNAYVDLSLRTNDLYIAGGV